MALTTKLALPEPGEAPSGTHNGGRAHVLLACFHTGLGSYWKGNGSVEITG